MFAPKIKMLQGMPEKMAMYYVAVIVSALEYLHEKNIVYRDLKPENVLLGRDGSAKLGDFGFAKKLDKGSHTYTFCGTPGYVAPEVVLARGYGTSVDWWGLGVLMYVLLTGQQPFSQVVNGQPEEPLTVMKRIVDRSWAVPFPMYLSESAVDIMSWFLERRSVKRLGNLRRKEEDVREHAWFRDAGFDWDLLRSGKMQPRQLALSDAFASAQIPHTKPRAQGGRRQTHPKQRKGAPRERNFQRFLTTKVLVLVPYGARSRLPKYASEWFATGTSNLSNTPDG